MEKEIIEQYIDACEVVKETEKEITRLKKKRKTIVQTNVSGSNPEFPYNPMHFKSIGTSFTYEEDSRLRREEKVLEEQKKAAERIKLEVEMWMLTIPLRMQRIIRYRIFEKNSWEKVAERLGRNATGESIKKEYQRFFEKKIKFVLFVLFVPNEGDNMVTGFTGKIHNHSFEKSCLLILRPAVERPPPLWNVVQW